jgi:hypothetical protein
MQPSDENGYAFSQAKSSLGVSERVMPSGRQPRLVLLSEEQLLQLQELHLL